MRGMRKLFRFFGNEQFILPWRKAQIIYLSAQYFAVSSTPGGILLGSMWLVKLASWKKMCLNSKHQGKPDKSEVCNVKYFSLIDWHLTFGLLLLFLFIVAFVSLLRKSISFYSVGRNNVFSNKQERGIFDWAAEKVLPGLLKHRKAEEFLKHFWHFLSLQKHNYMDTAFSFDLCLQCFSLVCVLGVELRGKGWLGWGWRMGWSLFVCFSFAVYFGNPGWMWVWKSTQMNDQPPSPVGSHNKEKV